MFWYKLSKGMRNPWKVLEHIVEYKGGAEGTNVTWTSFLSYQADAELERAPTQLSHSIQSSYVPKREGPISVIPSHRTFRVLLTLG